MKDTSERLLQLRKALKLSQEAFGAAIGMTRSEIKNIEYGKTVLKTIKVPLVCQAFNVSNEWLMTGEGEMFLLPTTEASTLRQDVNTMSLSDRIKAVRIKTGLSQTEFGAKIGVSRSVIQNLEDENRLTNPQRKEPLFRLICTEFNVSYDWLMKGQGEMILPPTTDAFEALVHEFYLSDNEKKLIKRFVNLDPTIRKKVVDFMIQFASDLSQA